MGFKIITQFPVGHAEMRNSGCGAVFVNAVASETGRNFIFCVSDFLSSEIRKINGEGNRVFTVGYPE